MKLQQIKISDKNQSEVIFSNADFLEAQANLVLVFGERVVLEASMPYAQLKQLYPNAQIVICSTAGQISNDTVEAENVIATAIAFEKTKIKVAEIDLLKNNSISALGGVVKKELLSEDLKSLLVISEGSYVNGSELVNELEKQTEFKIPIFGGLAGDNLKFERTLVGYNADGSEGKIVIIGFYGDAIHLGYGCEGGWSDFGPEREVSVAENNIVFKIGDRFALDLYKEYLGKYANDLPGSALYFPLSMKENKHSLPVVRTILSIDENRKSMTFAGNVPQGSFVRLMKGNVDKLIDASYNATMDSFSSHSKKPKLALVVSCVGRKVVLGNRIEEEFESVKEASGNETLICGFYSYGEIAPVVDKDKTCELHNQTIAVLTIMEE